MTPSMMHQLLLKLNGSTRTVPPGQKVFLGKVGISYEWVAKWPTHSAKLMKIKSRFIKIYKINNKHPPPVPHARLLDRAVQYGAWWRR